MTKTTKKDQPYTSKLQGVAALLGTGAYTQEPDTSKTAPTSVEISQIKPNPNQPRRYFDPQKLEELSRSIKELGILEPLLVRPSGGNYELVAGERRYKAAQMAGLTEVPVIVREMNDDITRQVQLVENLQREDLNPVEETEGILELLALRLSISREETIKLLQKMENEAKGKITRNVTGNSQTSVVEELFEALGQMKWDSFVRNRLPLLKLPQDVLEVLRSGQIEYTKAKAIARVKDEITRTELIQDAIAYNLSLNEIKQKTKAIQQQSKPEIPSAKDKVDETFRRLKQSKVWDDPKKKAKVEKLLVQLEKLMNS